jgi:hypothetical protein
MTEVGKFRNDVDGIDNVSLSHYDRIFKVYKYSIEDKEFNVYNILNKLDFGDIDGEFIELETIKAPTALPTIAYRLYNDIKLWWVIYLCNVDKFEGAPFLIESGTQIKYIKPEYLSLIHADITNQTIYDNKHF